MHFNDRISAYSHLASNVLGELEAHVLPDQEKKAATNSLEKDLRVRIEEANERNVALSQECASKGQALALLGGEKHELERALALLTQAHEGAKKEMDRMLRHQAQTQQVCVCVCVCVYVCMYVCMYVCIYVCII